MKNEYKPLGKYGNKFFIKSSAKGISLVERIGFVETPVIKCPSEMPLDEFSQRVNIMLQKVYGEVPRKFFEPVGLYTPDEIKKIKKRK